MVSAENGVVKTKKLITIHKMIGGGKNDIVMFSLSNESDGTKRLFDYIPLILDLMKGSKVFVVDEIERSLHPSLVYQIFKLFLSLTSLIIISFIFPTFKKSLTLPLHGVIIAKHPKSRAP